MTDTRTQTLSAKRRKQTQSAIQAMLDLARSGRFGTPEQPLRNSCERKNFWACYFGHRQATEYKGTVSYPAARAGELYRKESEFAKHIIMLVTDKLLM